MSIQMPKRTSPTQLTIKYLRARGIACAVVEKWVKAPGKQFGGFRKDTFGFDILCLIGNDTLGIQAGAASSHAAKITKAMNHPDVRLWLTSPHRSYIILTWRKAVARNKDGAKRKNLLWKPRATQLLNEDGAIISREFELK
jgi:hypothetical protein